MKRALLWFLICVVADGLLTPAAEAAEEGVPPHAALYEELLRQGDVLQAAGKGAEAREFFEKAGARAASPARKAEARVRVALTYGSDAEVEQAREHLLRALEMPGQDAAGLSRIRLLIARGYVAEYNGDAAQPYLEQILAERTVAAGVRAEAQVLRARIHARYGVAWAWEKVRSDCEAVLALPRTEAGEGNHIGAHCLLVEALLTQRQFEAARGSMRWLAGHPGVASGERIRQQLALVRTRLWEGDPGRALEDLALAQTLLKESRAAASDGARAFGGETRDVLEARSELLRGIALSESGKNAEAREALLRVAGLPGQTPASAETREAAVKLRLRGLLPSEEPCLKVLMVGSSLTIRGNIPYLIERMAASAPSGVPRICAGEHVRMGTGIRAFWAEGEAPDTVRYKIRTEPWDVLVVETFYRMTEADIAQYVGLYADLARSRGTRVVMYETPAAKSVPFPAGFESVHRANLAVGGRLGVPVAPSLLAWWRLLGQAPDKVRFDRLYADGLHATLRGAYTSACCVYAAVTGASPVGRFHPEEIEAAEARSLQEAAWAAFEETRQALPARGGEFPPAKKGTSL